MIHNIFCIPIGEEIDDGMILELINSQEGSSEFQLYASLVPTLGDRFKILRALKKVWIKKNYDF